jgi:hypothetical protein
MSTPRSQEKTPNLFQQATRKLQGLTPKKLFGSPKKAYEKPNSFDSQEMESVVKEGRILLRSTSIGDVVHSIIIDDLA